MNTTSTHATEELLSLEDAAELLCVSKSTLYRMLEREEVKGRKVGRQWRFLNTDLQAYLDRGARPVELSGVQPEVIAALRASLRDAAGNLGITPPAEETAGAAEEKLIAAVNSLFDLALAARASDIHLAPERDNATIRLRIDGMLREIGTVPAFAYRVLIGRIKEMSGMDLEERARPQDGRIRMTCGGREIDLRLNVIPTLFGESAVLRILDRGSILFGLDQLHFRPDDLARLHRWLALPTGLVLTVGPTGSGKTTTLYSCLQAVATPEKNSMTVEDPVEYSFPGIRQIAVNPRVGLTFAAALRSTLRHDPNVVMVGELRDMETIHVVIQMALTGAQVLSSLHANSAAAGAMRLTDIGVEPFLTVAATTGILAQRLVRRLCPHCRRPADLPAETRARVLDMAATGGCLLPADAPFFHADGCEQCGKSGFRGRIALYELLEFTPAVRQAFMRGANAEELSATATRDGMHTLLADGIQKAADGLTTIEEVLRVTAKW